MSSLVFDIETIGENFDDLDEVTQQTIIKWSKKDLTNGEDSSLEAQKKDLGLSPLTGEVIVIGVLDLAKNQGVVYFRPPDGAAKEFKEGSFLFKPTSEQEMLENFWQGAQKYEEFISFNGRAFDVPFLMVRSAVHKIRPTKDLLANRYLNLQPRGAKHIDLQEQLTFYGAMRRKGGLHLWCRSLGIESPKGQGISGEDVGELFRRGKQLEIARYNARDLEATRDLYKIWREYMNFNDR